MHEHRTKGHIALRKYLCDNNLSQIALASAAKISAMQVSHLVNGRRNASFRVAMRIDKATGGDIPARDWLS